MKNIDPNDKQLSARTRLAAMAMQGILSNGLLRVNGKDGELIVSKAAVQMADALINELNK